LAWAELAAKRRKRERLERFSDMRAAFHEDEDGDKEFRKMLTDGEA